MQSSSSAGKRSFTLKDKQKLLANLDIEVEHRTKQLEAWLSDAIESFRSRNEGYLSRIPRIVLGVKMRDLEAKYNGDVLTCMKILQMDRLAEGAAGVERSTKKRKWLAAQDADPERSDESSRAVKNPRISAATPRKMIPVAGYLSPTKSHLLRTPGTQRKVPPRPPLRGPSPNVRNGRIATAKARSSPPSKTSATPQSSRRPPSSATFNPAISNGAPLYPKHHLDSLQQRGELAGQTRYFVNGGELPGVREETEYESNKNGGVGSTLRRVNSITIRRQPSSLDFHSNFHPRPNQQATRTPPSRQPSHLKDTRSTHPVDPTAAGPPQQQPLPAQVHVTVPTVDGFFLEFNPLLVSPGALNELEGITDDAKKHAREEMVRLVKEAVSKWTI
ncbi:hypothetical protein BJ322DRAFT_482112 [Thelephora terrestris]|uniref:Borealin N-terminal domain-containing protein n=1 Tax=Thelephora terrestris TaxID=56493 RepID=A0A9P6H516_9AGAM|nr:hypothetical protein BJ322DRAFT_482112 [Thelephora terrestris]